MKYSVGIDLGSTTTKAVVLDEQGAVLGRGITNSRSNYEVACDVALGAALDDSRFALIAGELARRGVARQRREQVLAGLEARFREARYLEQLAGLAQGIEQLADAREGTGPEAGRDGVREGVRRILQRMQHEAPELFQPGARRRSDFFRDLAGSRYLALAEQHCRRAGLPFDAFAGLFDKAILAVENTPSRLGFEALAEQAVRSFDGGVPALGAAVAAAAAVPMTRTASVGTGYGRATLPFPREQIRSEILCHGLGAHALFPKTATVLDIGGQDTKAIQVDGDGIVTSFQMNDRCAAGCGRYLGYIADEMNLGLQELGPLAQQSRRPVRINSTCTVFAGAELRERLSLGERREDILAGLHRAIILRAMSLLARSGGISDEFTFTGGVARNPAAVAALTRLVAENYGALTLNISPDSIYTGALGAALFAHRAAGAAGGAGADAAAADSAGGATAAEMPTRARFVETTP